MSRRLAARRGFNLVEILITLTLVALLTTSLINFVNDFDDKTKVARARSDLARIAQQAVMAESMSGTKMTTDSIGMTGMVTMLADYLVELPPFDPWGNRYWVSSDGTVVTSRSQGVAYLIDPAFGRIISAGPDGVVNTDIGSGISDTDNDIVVEFRRQPWVVYSFTESGGIGEVYVARVDGTSSGKVMPHPDFHASGTGVLNVTFSPDGSRFCGVGNNGPGANQMVCGNTSPQNPDAFQFPNPVPTPENPTPGANSADVNTFPLFLPDGNQVLWLNNGDASLRVGNLLTRTTQVLINTAMNLDTAVALNDPSGRLLMVTKERSSYWRIQGAASVSIGIAASSDGKIAVGWYPPTGKKGIFLVLPGGTARRLLKEPSVTPAIEWLPVGWEDTNDLIYWGKKSGSKNVFRRIAQDGRFDIPLFNPDLQLVTNNDPSVPTISADGELISFIHSTGPPSKCKTLRTDGGGFLKGTDPDTSNFNMLLPVRFSPLMFQEDNIGLYYPAEHSGQCGIREGFFKLGNPLAPEERLPQFNSTFPVTPARAALGPNKLLVAVISSPDHLPNTHGVYVFPLLGPNGSYIAVSDPSFAHNGAGVTNLPNVAWILD